METLVMKFGGTSVGSAERFAAVADIIERTEATKPVVVVSAMSGTTSDLIDGARSASEGGHGQYRAIKDNLLARHLDVVDALLGDGPEWKQLAEYIRDQFEGYERLCNSIATLGELTMRGTDAVVSLGEEVSSHILAAILRARGIRAKAVSATTLVRTDDHYGSANPDMAATRHLVATNLRPLLEEATLPVVTGYIGATEQGVTTTLGRGGSDFSAAILGACLDADEVWIWTDVDGILSADPKLVPEARTLRELSYAEAEELAYFGADVLDPKTVAPLGARGIPLRILNSFAPDSPGTLIVPEPDPDRTVMPAIISTEGLCLIGVSGNGRGWSLEMASRALRCLANAGVGVLMFSQSFSERSLNLVVRRQDQKHSVNALKKEFDRDLALGLFSHIGTQEEVASISVVGMSNDPDAAIAPRAFAALGKLGLRVIAVAQPASAHSISFVISERDLGRAVPFIHRELGL
jgi:aspartate kinase